MRYKLSDIWAILILPCILFGLYGPLEIYLAQYDWFWFNLSEFIGYSFFISIISISSFIVLFLIFRKKGKMLQYISAVVFGLTLAAYIQGTYLRTSFGRLNGEEIQWSDYSLDMFLSVAIFCIIIVSVVLLTIKYKEKAIHVFNTISICIMLVFVFTIVVSSVNKKIWNSKEEVVATKKGEFDYSKNQNMIILIIDSLDSRYINEVLETSDFNKKLDGFVYFDNAAPVYNGTDYSVPQILTGAEYCNDRTYGDFLREAYSQSWIKKCHDEGWYVNGCLGDIYMTQASTDNIFDNYELRSLGVSSHRRLLIYMYKLVGFRYSPVPLKHYFWFYPDDMTDLTTIRIAEGEPEQVFTWDNKSFFDDLCSATINLQYDNPSLHIYYIKGLHFQIKYDENLNTEEGLDYTPQGATIAMLRLVEELCCRLKEAGIYDNTSIAVMGDHGTYVDSELFSSPAVLIKETGKKGELHSEEGVLYYKDISHIFQNMSMQISYDEDIQLEPRERLFFDIEWTGNMDSNSGGGVLKEYLIPSDSKDFDSIEATGKVIDVYK